MNRTNIVVNLNEPLVFEQSAPGKSAYSLPPLDVEEVALDQIVDPKLIRSDIPGFPEISEVELIRHYTRLSTWNYHVDLGLYPLGSCTMKYNPKLNERVARIPGLATVHPLLNAPLAQGNLKILYRLQELLKEITGMAGVTLQPAAGSQGELTGILMVRAYHAARNKPRKYVLIPDSAHGTNPASATISGYEVKAIPSDQTGQIDLTSLKEKMSDEVACLMLTNPNTLGIFESRIQEIGRIVHEAGALLYMDGANFNALLGQTRPGDMGIDVLHLNLHKTFSTPHGGGGPGSGPVACQESLIPFLPVPIVAKDGDKFRLDFDRPQTIGRLHAFFGNFGMMVRALAYILSCGGDGLKQISETAVLNANYIRKRLADHYDLPYDTPSLHEVVFSDKRQERQGVKTLDIAKRLIDLGFHPPTVYFPLIVHGALMIEPTESAGKGELDEFIEAMIQIHRETVEEPAKVTGAPTSAKVARLDETRAARTPVLRWKARGKDEEKDEG
ncbi:MAG: glycine dehydrogenase subunit 2 [Acidobacteria bacterium]|nr:MAG: glycine dehydrogenase subunit 2 [Acidobacteriota bacterium]